MSFIFHKGQLLPADQPIITAENFSFKWGEGLFETIKVTEGKICLQDYHFERMLWGLNKLAITCEDNFFIAITEQIKTLCKKNKCAQAARVRLAVYRNDKGVAETVLQAVPLGQDIGSWNKKGWKIDLYKEAVKTADALANLKTASYLPYLLAARFAKEKGVDECLLLNNKGAVCDGSRTNIFIISGGTIYTPSLSEGCIAGVMRRHIITELSKKGIEVMEDAVTVDRLRKADEVFVSNALINIKWIEKFEGKTYAKSETQALFKKLFD